LCLGGGGASWAGSVVPTRPARGHGRSSWSVAQLGRPEQGALERKPCLGQRRADFLGIGTPNACRGIRPFQCARPPPCKLHDSNLAAHSGASWVVEVPSHSKQGALIEFRTARAGGYHFMCDHRADLIMSRVSRDGSEGRHWRQRADTGRTFQTGVKVGLQRLVRAVGARALVIDGVAPSPPGRDGRGARSRAQRARRFRPPWPWWEAAYGPPSTVQR
jgi:hypothetical protein